MNTEPHIVNVGRLPEVLTYPTYFGYYLDEVCSKGAADRLVAHIVRKYQRTEGTINNWKSGRAKPHYDTMAGIVDYINNEKTEMPKLEIDSSLLFAEYSVTINPF